eukprot:scaffold69570_cov36-Tisochrysis_lutea.AAC.1
MEPHGISNREHIAAAHAVRGGSRGGRAGGRAGRAQQHVFTPAGQRAGTISSRGRPQMSNRGGRGRGGSARGGAVPGTDGRLLRDIDCYNCHRYGHYAEQCPSPPRANAALGLNMACAYCSGANFHISTSSQHMTDMRQPPVHLRRLNMGEGWSNVEALGTLQLQLANNSAISLHNVFYAPNYALNTFVEHRATATGSTVQFKNSGAEVTGPDGALVISAYRSQGLCWFNARTKAPSKHTAPAFACVTHTNASASQSAGVMQHLARNTYASDFMGTSTHGHTRRGVPPPPTDGGGSCTGGQVTLGTPMAQREGSVALACDARPPSARDQQHVSMQHISGGFAADVWHRRLGHPGGRVLGQLRNAVTGVQMLGSSKQVKDEADKCEVCRETKQAEKPHPSRSSKSTQPLELMHTDVAPYLPPWAVPDIS